MPRTCHLICDKQIICDKQKNTYIVLFKGDDTDFAWNQEIALEIETDLDLTGFTAKFSVLGFVQDFDDITSKKLNLVFPAEETSKFPLGMTGAVFEVFDSDGKKRTVINTLKVLVTKSVYEAYSNEDPQAITVSISGTIEREQSDWTETDTSSPSFIKHKPDLGEKLDGDAVYEKWYDSDYYEPDTIVSHKGFLWKCIRFTPEEPSDSAEDWEKIRAEDILAPKNSPNFIGTPTAPTAPTGTKTEQIATTEFVENSLQAKIPEPSSQTPLEDGDGSPGTGNKFSRQDHVHPHDSSKQDKLSKQQLDNINDIPNKANASDVPTASSETPLMDGTPSAGSSGNYSRGDHVHPIDTSRQAKINASGLLKGNGSGGVTAASAGTDYQAPLTSDQITNINAVPSKAPIASPELTGTPTAPTAPNGTNTTQIATTAFVHGAVSDKANVSDLPYALVTRTPGPDLWSFSGDVQSGVAYSVSIESDGGSGYNYTLLGNGDYLDQTNQSTDAETEIEFFASGITASRPSTNAASLLDRSVNAVLVTDATTLTLPAAVAGYARDFLVRLEISGSTVPTITFSAPTGETVVYETDGDEFPVPDEAGNWLYSFTETKAGVFAVALKKVNTVAQGGA